MMIAYDDGSLIDEINSVLKGDKSFFLQFKVLFDDIEEYNNEIINAIYNFVFAVQTHARKIVCEKT